MSDVARAPSEERFASSAQQADVGLVAGVDAAATMLQPLRLQILGHLRDPDSAAGVARVLGLPRQRVHYHVRALEDEGLLRQVGQRKRGNCVENLLQTTARRYLIAPQALGDIAPDPDQVADRLSSGYALATAARTLRDVGVLREGARKAEKKLATLTLETEVRFPSPEAAARFARELTEFVRGLAARYHEEGCEPGRSFRFVFQGHPSVRRPGNAAQGAADSDSRPPGADHERA